METILMNQKPYPNIINQHLIEANRTQAAFHDVCNWTCCHN